MLLSLSLVVSHTLTYQSSGELAVEGDNVRLTRADILQQEHEQEQEQQYVETEASYAENRLQEMRVLQVCVLVLYQRLLMSYPVVGEYGNSS